MNPIKPVSPQVSVADETAAFQAMSRKQLSLRVNRGSAARPEELAGFAFRGLSLGLPKVVDKLMWKTFAKVFVPTHRGTSGFNLKIVQQSAQGLSSDPLAAPLQPRARNPRFGEFDVCESDGHLVLDYSGRNRPWSPLHRVRDLIVPVTPDLFLGETRLAIGRRTIGTPSFFILQRASAVASNLDFETAHVGLAEI